MDPVRQFQDVPINRSGLFTDGTILLGGVSNMVDFVIAAGAATFHRVSVSAPTFLEEILTYLYQIVSALRSNLAFMLRPPKNSGGTVTHEIPLEGVSDADDAPIFLTPEQEKQLWRRLDWHLIPILSLMYLLSFIDKSNIGNAKLDGILKQLDLTGNRYNIALAMFFFSYAAFECPSNLALKVLRPSRWLPGIMVLWGLIMVLMGFVKTYPQLVAARACLGIAEAGLFPGATYYLTLWYPRHMLQYRIGLFFGAATMAGAFSGLLAFGIGYMDGIGGLEGWSWIFIIEGLLTVLVALIAPFLIINSPSDAGFLTPEERAYLVWRKKYDNSTIGEEEHFALRHVIAAFTDWQVYLHGLLLMSLAAPLFGITFFLPTIINDFGYSTPISQLLTIPPYVVATITLLTWSHYSDKLKIRSAFIFFGSFLMLIGFSINISNSSRGIKYFGTFLVVIGSYSSIPGAIAWMGNNLSGHYKRAVGMAIPLCLGNLSPTVAVNTYLSKDAPRFILGHALEMMFSGIAMTVVLVLVYLYKRVNHARDEAQRQRSERGEKLDLTLAEWRDLGDRAPDFRYTL